MDKIAEEFAGFRSSSAVEIEELETKAHVLEVDLNHSKHVNSELIAERDRLQQELTAVREEYAILTKSWNTVYLAAKDKTYPPLSALADKVDALVAERDQAHADVQELVQALQNITDGFIIAIEAGLDDFTSEEKKGAVDGNRRVIQARAALTKYVKYLPKEKGGA